MRLVVDGISKAFGEKIVLRDAHYVFEEGRIYALLGRNGSGKTTLFRTLYKDIEAEQGRCYLEDHGHISEIDHKQIGMIHAESMLPDFLTGYEYLKFYADINAPTEIHQIDALFDQMDFPISDRHRLIREYSSGMKSKVAIIAILLSRPQIILLDEPLTAVDVVASLEIKKQLLKLRDQHIIIMSTHIIQLAKEVCEDVVLLHNGELRHFESAMNEENFDQSLLAALTEGEA